MADMSPYIVKQGDHLDKLAFMNGFDADTVWNDPKNADLKQQRPNPNMLAPGDVLYIPKKTDDPQSINQGTSNAYTATVPAAAVSLTFKTQDGPLANEPYVIDGLGDQQQGTTDGSGTINLSVPAHLREIQLTFPNRNITYPIGVGDLDPIEEPSGVRQRLRHLAFAVLPDPADDESSLDEAAISAFQEAQGLPVTGTVDDATRAALLAAHGC
jgi:peptidoglycan hydrolase-like protein with peptidoglycan-binding domain